MEPELDDAAPPKRSLDRFLVVILAIALPFAVGLGVWLGVSFFGPAGASSPAPVPSASAAPEAEPSAAVPKEEAPKTLVDRAAAGDYKAIDELAAKPVEQRTVEETLALARGRSGNNSRALVGFATEIKKKPELLNEQDPRDRLREFFMSPQTTNQAAAVIAGLPGALGPDMFYDVVTKTKQKTDVSQLAEDLLASPEVRQKASPALQLALDLRGSTECEDFKALLAKVHEQGDKRSVPYLLKLGNKRGCGPTKRDDCYACIRDLEKDKEAIDLGKAIMAARKRAGPAI
jgi:hypothetical protein